MMNGILEKLAIGGVCLLVGAMLPTRDRTARPVEDAPSPSPEVVDVDGANRQIEVGSGDDGSTQMYMIDPRDGSNVRIGYGRVPMEDIAEDVAEYGEAGQGVPEDRLLTLVNDQNPLPEDWQVCLVNVDGSHQMDISAAGSLKAMLDAAEAEGLDPLVCSAYRTRAKQEQLFNNRVQRCRDEGLRGDDAVREAMFWVARPDRSEHQMGLAADIVSVSNQRLDDSQLNTDTQQWLMAHCWEYGFILRYPPEKSDITGIGHEPWHYRYVGTKAAKAITESGLCLEEWLEKH